MIEEQGRVLSVEPGAVWVETVRRSTCGSCQARAGCGQALLHKVASRSRQGFVRVLTDRSHQIGEEVVIGIPEQAVVSGSTWVYLVPLAGLFLFALLAQALSLAEPWIIVAAGAGLLLGLLTVRLQGRRHAGDPRFQPQVLRTLSGSLSAAASG